MSCPLCDIGDREPENVLYEDADFWIVNCKFNKGHRERIMIVWKLHKKKAPWYIYYKAINVLSKFSQKLFNYTYRYVVMDGTFGSIPEHFHLVATDLDPTAFDFHQILATVWLETDRTGLEFTTDQLPRNP